MQDSKDPLKISHEAIREAQAIRNAQAIREAQAESDTVEFGRWEENGSAPTGLPDGIAMGAEVREDSWS